MFRVSGDFTTHRDWRLIAFAGLVGAIASLAAMGFIFFYTGIASTSFAQAMLVAVAALAALTLILG